MRSRRGISPGPRRWSQACDVGDVPRQSAALSARRLRPNALVPIEQAVTMRLDVGPNRFPTSAQNPYLISRPSPIRRPSPPGHLGRNVFESPG